MPRNSYPRCQGCPVFSFTTTGARVLLKEGGRRTIVACICHSPGLLSQAVPARAGVITAPSRSSHPLPPPPPGGPIRFQIQAIGSLVVFWRIRSSPILLALQATPGTRASPLVPCQIRAHAPWRCVRPLHTSHSGCFAIGLQAPFDTF